MHGRTDDMLLSRRAKYKQSVSTLAEASSLRRTPIARASGSLAALPTSSPIVHARTQVLIAELHAATGLPPH